MISLKRKLSFALCFALMGATPVFAYSSNNNEKPYTLTVPSLEGRLTYSADGKTATLFAPYTSKAFGWYDVNKRFDGKDGHLCWAASNSNILAWYLDSYKRTGLADVSKYESNVERIFEKHRDNWNPSEGFDPMQGLAWYFTGETLDGKKPAELLNYPSGGYLKELSKTQDRWSVLDIYNPSIIGSYENKFPFIDDVNGVYYESSPLYSHRSFSETIREQLLYGATVINVGQNGASATGSHAINLWGCDYDVKTGLINKIYVTDSDDESMYAGSYIKELKIKARKPDKQGIYIEGYYLPGNASPITKITSSMLVYAPGVVKDHNLTRVPRVEPTCEKEGNIEYWYCEVHNKKFSDESGKNEITESVVIPKLDHKISEEWITNEDNHWHECLVGGEKVEQSSHTFNWIIDKEATTTEVGYKHEECSVCGYKKEKVVIDMLPAPIYSVVEGGNTTYNPMDKDEVISFKVDAKGSQIKNIYINDLLVDSSNYEVKDGTTIVFKNDFISTLEDGKYILNVEFKDNGKASAKFDIKKVENLEPEIPEIEKPEVPQIPEVPENTDVEGKPEVPELPETPQEKPENEEKPEKPSEQTDKNHGNISGQTESNNGNKEEAIPQTGEKANWILYSIVSVLSAMVMFVIPNRKKELT